MKNKFNPRVLQKRATRFNSSDLDTENRTVAAALSSETEVQRFFGTEVLLHEKGAIDLSRAKHGIPLLFNHDPSKPIGRVDNVRLANDGKLRGELTFSNNSLANEIFRDVSEDFLNGVSIGYRIEEFTETDQGIKATRWSLHEASIVAIEADTNAGINRSLDNNENIKTEDSKMSDTDKKKIAADAVTAFKAKEATRQADVKACFKNHTGADFDALESRAIADTDFTPDQVRQEMLTLLGKDTAAAGASTSYGEDEGEKMQRGIEEALKCKVGAETDKSVILSARSNEFFGFSMMDIARVCLERSGHKMRGKSNMQIMGDAFTMGQRAIHGVVDFPNILANVSNASMQMAYEEADETWRKWARVGNLSDFKLTDRANLSAFEDLPVVADKEDYTEGSFSDLKESLQLATYGRLFKLTRQAMINDSLDGLGRIPQSMGRAAARTVGTLAYNVLINNMAMNQDGLPVFDDGHDNDVDSGGSAPTNGLVEQGILNMALQQDPSENATLGITPQFLVVPTSMASSSRVLMSGEFEPGTAPGNLQPNPHRGIMEVVSEHRLERDADKPWFMIAGQNNAETVEVAFLNGADSPTLEQEDPFVYDGVTFKVRIDAAAQAIDFRGMQRFTDQTPE